MRTALTISDDAAWRLLIDQREAEARARATRFVCGVAAMGFVEGAERATRAIIGPALGPHTVRQGVVQSFPGYTAIRNFLMGELDADYVIACRVAAYHTQAHNRCSRYVLEQRDPYSAGREIGWL
jgi:hypothetical protein